MALKRRTQVLAGCVFIDLFAVSLIVPLLPMRYKELGVSQVMIGMIGSLYSAAQILGGLIIGALSDRIDDRRKVCLIHSIAVLLSSITFFIAA